MPMPPLEGHHRQSTQASSTNGWVMMTKQTKQANGMTTVASNAKRVSGQQALEELSEARTDDLHIITKRLAAAKRDAKENRRMQLFGAEQSVLDK